MLWTIRLIIQCHRRGQYRTPTTSPVSFWRVAIRRDFRVANPNQSSNRCRRLDKTTHLLGGVCPSVEHFEGAIRLDRSGARTECDKARVVGPAHQASRIAAGVIGEAVARTVWRSDGWRRSEPTHACRFTTGSGSIATTCTSMGPRRRVVASERACGRIRRVRGSGWSSRKPCDTRRVGWCVPPTPRTHQPTRRVERGSTTGNVNHDDRAQSTGRNRQGAIDRGASRRHRRARSTQGRRARGRVRARVWVPPRGAR
jgi:hypothetical protein